LGQLVTLIEDQLSLSLIAALGFGEIPILMFVMVWLAARNLKKRQAAAQAQALLTDQSTILSKYSREASHNAEPIPWPRRSGSTPTLFVV